MDIVLIGPQGSGKGTQGKLMAATHGYTIFETGAVLRSMAKENSELGIKIKTIIESGELVSNDLVMEIVEDFVSKNQDKEIIFDGIPRSEIQRESFETLMQKLDRNFIGLEVAVPEEETYKRLFERAKIEGRADDNETAIKKRLENYTNHTAPIVQIWKQNKKCISINGCQSIENVTMDIETILSFIK